MKHILEVCLIAFTAGSFTSTTAAQSPVMQRGISVALAPTHNASPRPEADRPDAFIITVAADGSICRGIDPITLPELTETFRSTPFKRGQALYIKADARAPYATVLSVLEATRNNGLVPQVLLTSQPESVTPGATVQPEGMDVSVDLTFPSGTVATVVQLLTSGEASVVKVNNNEISQSTLEETLRQHFQKGDDKLVLLRASGRLSFAEVVHAVDNCRAAGARVYLAHLES